MSLLTMMTGFGLATAAGSRAWLVALALGVFHHTSYFELSPKFVWLASAPVMAVLGVLTIAEIVWEASPNVRAMFPESVTTLSSLIVGGLALMAVTGDLDGNLMLLMGSGLLGSVTGFGVRYLRNSFMNIFSETAEGLEAVVGEDTAQNATSYTETAAAAAVVGGSFLAPAVFGGCAILLVLFLAVQYFRSRNPAPAEG